MDTNKNIITIINYPALYCYTLPHEYEADGGKLKLSAEHLKLFYVLVIHASFLLQGTWLIPHHKAQQDSRYFEL